MHVLASGRSVSIGCACIVCVRGWGGGPCISSSNGRPRAWYASQTSGHDKGSAAAWDGAPCLAAGVLSKERRRAPAHQTPNSPSFPSCAVRAAGHRHVSPFVRVPWNETGDEVLTCASYQNRTPRDFSNPAQQCQSPSRLALVGTSVLA